MLSLPRYKASSLSLVLIPGAFFGSTFAPLFFQTYPDLLSQPFCPAPSPSAPPSAIPSSAPSPSASSSAPVGGETVTNPNPHGGQKPALGRVYTPRIYGFKVSERARSGPRMKWLRERPARAEELDHVDNRGRWIDATRTGEVRDEVEGKDGKSGKRGKLFDDEDEEQDDDEEEEEEEEGPAASASAQVHAQSNPVTAERRHR